MYQASTVDNLTPLLMLNNYFTSLYPLIFDFILRLITGLVIIFVGWLIALLVKLAFEFILKNINFETLLKAVKLDKYFEDFSWEERFDKVMSDIVFWVVIIVFLMSAFDVFGLRIVNEFLRNILNYFPRAVSGGIILFVGIIFGELIRKFLVGFLKGLEKKSAQSTAVFIKWAIIVFALVTALNQWGVAPEIMNILVFGFVLFLALALGLSFGLGGQEIAREILESVMRRFR